MSTLPFRCGCGRPYDAARWAKLPLVGYACTPHDAYGPEEHLEYRNCPCRSTKAVRVATGHAGCTLVRSSRDRMEEIERKIRERRRMIRAFIRFYGERPFYAPSDAYPKMQIAVTRDLHPQRRGAWRTTWIDDGEPHGHSEFGDFAEAVRFAVGEFRADLSRAVFAKSPSPSRDARRRR